MSFALGMTEDVDTRKIPSGWDLPGFDASDWQAASVIEKQDNWGQLEPRSIPLLEEVADRLPQDIYLQTATLASGLVVHHFNLKIADAAGTQSAVAITLDSPAAQAVTFTATTHEVWFRGTNKDAEVYAPNDPRMTFTFPLAKGRNTLVIGARLLGDFFQAGIAWPEDANLSLASNQASALPPSETPLDEQAMQLEALLADGDSTSGLLTVPLQAGLTLDMQRGWRELTPPTPQGAFPQEFNFDLSGGKCPVYAMDFAREVLGRIQITFDAPAGTTLIFTASERLMPDSSIQTGFQLTRLQHRIVAKGGRQTWVAMHPFGFRFLELMVIQDSGTVRIESVDTVRIKAPYNETGRFLCSDASLNQIWQLCRETQVSSLEDAYIDCPWRERGLYTGDQIIQFYLNLALFGDHTMMRRCVNLFYQGQDESGLLPPCSHGLPNWRHPDYAALSVESLWHYWARTGDVAFVIEKADALERLLEALDAMREPAHGLVDGEGRIPYVDMSQVDRGGVSFALNAMICGAFQFGADLLQLAGKAEAAAKWQTLHAEQKARLREAFLRNGLFLDRRPEEMEAPKPSGLGNVLAVYYGIAETAEITGCIDFAITRARTNQTVPEPKLSFDFHFSAYSSFYLLEVLYRHNHGAEAERYIRREWRRMLDGGAWTCWEYFVPSHSLCHAWAASPGWFLSSKVLGLDYVEPGNPNRLRFAPHTGSLEWAEGSFPHPTGAIDVSWQQTANGPAAEIVAPSGIEIVDTEGNEVPYTLKPGQFAEAVV